MSAIICKEKGDKRQVKLGINASGSTEWAIGKTDSETDALVALYAAAPQLVSWNITGWVTFTGYFMDAHVKQDSDMMWTGTVNYGDPTNNTAAQPVGWSILDFELGGGSQKLMYGLDEHGYVTAPNVVSGFSNAINPDENGNPQGVEISVNAARFSVTQIFKPTAITDVYIQQVNSILNNPVNDNDFYFYNAISKQVMFHANTGELIIRGAAGRQRSQDKFEMTFRFEYSPNCDGTTQSTITIGNGATAITGISKTGWQYLWCKFGSQTDGTSGAVVPVPTQAVVNTVQGSSDFTLLGIGLHSPP